MHNLHPHRARIVSIWCSFAGVLPFNILLVCVLLSLKAFASAVVDTFLLFLSVFIVSIIGANKRDKNINITIQIQFGKSAFYCHALFEYN